MPIASIVGAPIVVYTERRSFRLDFAVVTLGSDEEKASTLSGSSVIFLLENLLSDSFQLSIAASIFFILPIIKTFHTVAPEALSTHSIAEFLSAS